METSKITIRLERKSHVELKMMAVKQKITLNQVCLDLIHAGLKELSENSSSLSELGQAAVTSNSIMIQQILARYESNDLKGILKTDGYIADYVLIFGERGVPAGVLTSFPQLVQALQIPNQELAPSLMWIEIAQKHELLWAVSDEVKNEIAAKLDRWGG